MILAVGLAVLTGVIALPASLTREMNLYRFADTRSFLGLPNALDVLSNLPFALIGLAGLARHRQLEGAARPAGLVFFASLLAVALGSSFYHLGPGPARLLFDRLPITVAFMALLALVLGDRVSPRLARLALVPLIAAAAAAALVWYFGGEQRGGGDLRPYALTQALPLAVIPLLLALFPGRLDERRFVGALCLYLAAKGFEALDAQVYELGQLVSGHTLKHLCAGAACFLLMPVRVGEPHGSAPPSVPAASATRSG